MNSRRLQKHPRLEPWRRCPQSAGRRQPRPGPGRAPPPAAEAASRLRAGRCDEVEAHGTVYRVARSRRPLRWGPDGPESPRPSDISTHAPAALHPCLDEDGTVHFDERAGDEPACHRAGSYGPWSLSSQRCGAPVERAGRARRHEPPRAARPP
ncbi:DUF5954 family protein [Streptomyces wedmorensis]